jgi:hypothetical protein
MYKKLIYLVCFVLVMSLASSAFADPNVNVWTNANATRLWTDPLNWDKGVVPGPGTHNTRISSLPPEGGYMGGGGPMILAGQNATTGDWDTWGPEWGIGLDIRGGSLTSAGA